MWSRRRYRWRCRLASLAEGEMASHDPVRDAYNKCARALEPLASDAERQRVVRALAMLFGLTPFDEPKL